jgi:hypothetical protein
MKVCWINWSVKDITQKFNRICIWSFSKTIKVQNTLKFLLKGNVICYNMSAQNPQMIYAIGCDYIFVKIKLFGFVKFLFGSVRNFSESAAHHWLHFQELGSIKNSSLLKNVCISSWQMAEFEYYKKTLRRNLTKLTIP